MQYVDPLMCKWSWTFCPFGHWFIQCSNGSGVGELFFIITAKLLYNILASLTLMYWKWNKNVLFIAIRKRHSKKFKLLHYLNRHPNTLWTQSAISTIHKKYKKVLINGVIISLTFQPLCPLSTMNRLNLTPSISNNVDMVLVFQ